MAVNAYTTLLILLLAFFAKPDLTPLNINSSSEIIVATGKQPDLVIDKKGNIKITYGANNTVYYITSTDGGETFTGPETVASFTKMGLGMGRGPQITATKDFTLISAVTDGGDVYGMRQAADKKWSKPIKINDVDTTAKEGFVAVSATAKNNNAFAIWLDLRTDHQNKIYGARSEDGGLTWEKNQLIYQGTEKTVCECCKPSVVADGNGNVNVMFRNWLLGSRNMYVISSKNNGQQFGQAQQLGTGNWVLKGCPMDGGDMSTDDQGKLVTVWRREKDIFLAEPGKPEIKIGEGRTPTVVNTAQGPAIAWMQNGEIMFKSPASLQTVSIGKGTFPKLAVLPNEKTAICSWEQDGHIIVKKITL